MSEHELKELKWNDSVTKSSPHPYVLCTTIDEKGRGNIIGLGWWTICSWSPPMMAISVAPGRYSKKCLDHCPEFVICLVGEEHAKGAWVCGTKSGKNVDDKFKEAGFTPIPSLQVKPPTIGESILAYECAVKDKVETGDHILYTGEVKAVRGVEGENRHLYSIHYKKLISLGPDGTINFNLIHK